MLRKKTAKELLADSFRELAERTGVHRITVKAIADNCGYSLATFYRCFRDKHDLITWDYARQVNEIVAPVAGTVKQIPVTKGQSVDTDTLLAVL